MDTKAKSSPYRLINVAIVLAAAACGSGQGHHQPDMRTQGGPLDMAGAATHDMTAAPPGADMTGAADLAEADGATPPVISSFTATPNVIPAGATRTVTLSWSVTGASNLSISGIGVVTGTSLTTMVSAPTTFTLTATSPTGGVATANATVTVDNGAIGTYIDAVNGNDTTGNGTPGMPFQTLAKVATVASSGKTIYAAAGTYPLMTGAVHIADGVGIEALTPGSVTFSYASGCCSYGITFDGSGFIHGAKIDHAFINVAAGTVNLDGVQLSNNAPLGTANAAGINVSASGHVVVTPGGLTNYVGAGEAMFAFLSGMGKLEIHGGAIKGLASSPFSGDAAFNVNDTSQLLLDGVTIDCSAGPNAGAIIVGGSAQVTLQNGAAIVACVPASAPAPASLNIRGSSTPTVLLDNSTISKSPGWGILAGAASTPIITLRNGTLIEKSAQSGVRSAGSLTLDHATISANTGTGVDVDGDLVTMAGTLIQGNAKGINFNGGSYTVTMRGTQVVDNVNDGVGGALAPTSAIDFGSVATAGGNTFKGNAAAAATSSNVNLSISTGSLVIDAIGNTWDGVQGADGAGRFPSGTTFNAPVNGKNVQLAKGGATSLSLVATP